MQESFGTIKHDPKKPPTDLANTGLSIQHLAKPEGRKREIRSGKASPEAGASWWQVATVQDCDFRCSLSILISKNSLLNRGEETLLAIVSGPGGGLQEEAWVLIPAQLFIPHTTQSLPLTLPGPQCHHKVSLVRLPRDKL